jgi:hypothetical protein
VAALRRFPVADEAWLQLIRAQRPQLLSAALAIWRYGRQLERDGRLAAGQAFGGYELWCRHARDPLLALDCVDPVDRIHELRAADPQREHLAELYSAWWEKHEDAWVAQTRRKQPETVHTLAEEVRAIADPRGRGAQFLRTYLNGLDGMYAAGFRFERFADPQRPTVPSTYRLTKIAEAG